MSADVGQEVSRWKPRRQPDSILSYDVEPDVCIDKACGAGSRLLVAEETFLSYLQVGGALYVALHRASRESRGKYRMNGSLTACWVTMSIVLAICCIGQLADGPSMARS